MGFYTEVVCTLCCGKMRCVWATRADYGNARCWVSGHWIAATPLEFAATLVRMFTYKINNTSFDGCPPSSPAYPGAPQNISANVFSSTSLTISWRPPLAEQTYGAIVLYYFYVTSTSLSYNLSPNTTSQQVNGLLPYTTYACYVWASNSFGWGPYAYIQVTTPPSGTEVIILCPWLPMGVLISCSADPESHQLLCVCGQLNVHSLDMEPTCSQLVQWTSSQLLH